MTSINKYNPSCSFLLGRAGSGKTYGCLAAMAVELQRSPRGLPLVLLAPEQATAQLERRLATWPGLLGGTTRARVFSFHHLAREAFLRGGGTPARQLGDLGRVMLLRQALRRRQGELSALGQSATQPGVAETLSQTLLEFQRYGWRRADLEDWLAAEILRAGEHSLSARKVRDLALLWRDYEEALATGGWDDPVRLYEAAANAIGRADWLDRAWIWVDGFASFTSLEQTLLEALAAKAERMVFALCLDPGQLEHKRQMGGRMRPRIGVERFFENMEETYERLKQRLMDLGVSPDRISEVSLPADGQAIRFSPSPALEHLERRVLGRMHPERCDGEDWARSQALLGGPPIELLEAADRRAEVEAIARRIVTLCRRDPLDLSGRPCLLWREVAVLARDLAPYEIHLREVFHGFKIPFFLDRPRAVEGHPLARSILSALGVLRAGWAGQTVLQHIKSGLCGLVDEDAIGMLENAIRGTDPRGALWQRRVEQDEQLRPLWHQAAAPLRRLEGELRTLPPPRAIWNFLEAIQAAPRLEAWIAEAQQAGDEEAVQLHEQAWEQTVLWLEEFEKILQALPELFPQSAERMATRERITELMGLIEAALASTRARLVPPTLNQVTVGAVDRSRTPEVRALFVIGLNDGEFPRLWQPEALLGDQERDELTRDGRRLGPDTRRKRLQEHFLAYIALTRAGERLVLSRPQVDDEGRVCDPSPYFTLVAQTFPQASLRAVKRAGAGEDADLPLRPEEWALRLGLTLGNAGAGEGNSLRAALAASERLLKHPELDPSQRRALALARARLAPSPTAALVPALASVYWQGGAILPVTALESYGECPFKFFVQRMLRLGQRQEAMLNVQELGTLRHTLLDRLFQVLRGENGLAWGQVDPNEADRVIDAQLQLLRQEEPWRARLDASALGAMTFAEVGEEIKRLARALILVGRRSRFMQVASEWSFGRQGELTIEAGGRRFTIRGTIDRVDALSAAAGQAPLSILIDYKSGLRKLNLGRLIEGIDLQLLTYALAWRSAESRAGAPGGRIGGFFYWPLTAPVQDASPGDGAPGEMIDERWFQKHKPSGIFAEDVAAMLDGEVGPESGSPVFSFRRTKEGKLHGGGQSHWPAEGLQALLDHEQKILAQWVGAIVQGRIAIHPCAEGKNMACQRCDYGGICRKADPVTLPVRRIPGMKREEALARLWETKE